MAYRSLRLVSLVLVAGCDGRYPYDVPVCNLPWMDTDSGSLDSGESDLTGVSTSSVACDDSTAGCSNVVHVGTAELRMAKRRCLEQGEKWTWRRVTACDGTLAVVPECSISQFGEG